MNAIKYITRHKSTMTKPLTAAINAVNTGNLTNLMYLHENSLINLKSHSYKLVKTSLENNRMDIFNYLLISGINFAQLNRYDKCAQNKAFYRFIENANNKSL